MIKIISVTTISITVLVNIALILFLHYGTWYELATWEQIFDTYRPIVGILIILGGGLFVVYVSLAKNTIKANKKLFLYVFGMVLTLLLPITILSSLNIEGRSTVAFDCERSHVAINGVLTLSTIYQYEHAKYVSGCKVISTINVSGRGGSNTVANYLIASLKEQGIKNSTAFGDLCASSCTGIWASFPNRTLDESTRLGFHRSKNIAFESIGMLIVWYEDFPTETTRAFIKVAHNQKCILDKDQVIKFGLLDRDDVPDVTAKAILKECLQA